ncbi:MAG TPA: hypothetical protein DC034_10070 [Clostridium sp.]|nr:helix-turn-helix domain-containing protein [Clostridiales bacterium]HBC97125.1 hypothetical protein [Clostridium sp.]
MKLFLKYFYSHIVSISSLYISTLLKNNKARAVRFSTLEAICRELKCQPGDLLEYKEND